MGWDILEWEKCSIENKEIKMYKISAVILILSASIMSASFTVTIGKPSIYSAKITVDNGDTSNRTSYDSLCPAHRYIQFSKLNMGSYDYKITVIRNMIKAGSLYFFSSYTQYAYLNNDTLKCDSLGFLPGANSFYSFSDTITNDTTIYYWIYPRPVSKAAVSATQNQIYGFSNHLKLFLRTPTFTDSIIITRQKIIFNSIRSSEYSIDKQRVSLLILRHKKNICIYNLKGNKLGVMNKNAVTILYDKERNVSYKHISYK